MSWTSNQNLVNPLVYPNLGSFTHFLYLKNWKYISPGNDLSLPHLSHLPFLTVLRFYYKNPKYVCVAQFSATILIECWVMDYWTLLGQSFPWTISNWEGKREPLSGHFTLSSSVIILVWFPKSWHVPVFLGSVSSIGRMSFCLTPSSPNKKKPMWNVLALHIITNWFV